MVKALYNRNPAENSHKENGMEKDENRKREEEKHNNFTDR